MYVHIYVVCMCACEPVCVHVVPECVQYIHEFSFKYVYVVVHSLLWLLLAYDLPLK